jgi:hypothetical protein
MSDDESLEHVRAVLARHKNELMALPQVTGVGIGAGSSDNLYAIVVYLRSPVAAPEGPTSVDGIPVKYVKTGTITLQTSRHTGQ